MKYSGYYCYPAVFDSQDPTKIRVHFVDFVDCVCYGKDIDDAIVAAKAAVSKKLFELAEQDIKLPEPTDTSLVKLADNQCLIKIEPIYQMDDEGYLIRRK